MKISREFDAATVSALGSEALALLRSRDFSTAAGRFGYALANGRDIETAIREDWEFCISSLGTPSLEVLDHAVPTVTIFKANSASLVAAVAFVFRFEGERLLLIDLMVTSNGEERFLVLEDIHVAA